ncbi:15-hydroxyprostaglandin dehydrogenase [Seiridium cupressi]
MSEPVAIVTGAASGMGLAATRHLLGKGYRVVMADINELGSQPSCELGDKTFFRKTDVSSYKDLASLFSLAFRWGGGRVDVLAANAGIDDKQSLYQDSSSMALDENGSVRSAGPVMLCEDGTTVNCFCPGFVMTGICPPEMKEVSPPEHITPMSTIMRAFDMFIEDDTMTGQCIEASLGDLYPRLTLPFVNSSQKWIVEDRGISRQNKDAPPLQKF